MIQNINKNLRKYHNPKTSLNQNQKRLNFIFSTIIIEDMPRYYMHNFPIMKSTIKLNLLILLFLPLCSFSQRCYDYFEDALYLSKFNEYKSLADSILEIEILNETKDFRVYLLKSKFEYEKENLENGFQLLTKAVKYGCHLRHHIFTDKFFKKYINQSDSLTLLKVAKKELVFPFEASNRLSIISLYELVHWDQALNNYTIRFHDSMCLSPSQSRVLELKITRNMLRQYLKDYGYPNEKEFGSVLVDRFDLVVIHHFEQVDSCEWLKSYYDEAYKMKKITPQRYYELYEKFLVYKDLPQKYGAFTSGRKINGRYEIYPIEDIEHIDKLRKQLSLSPLHVFLKNNNINIPENYSFDMKEYVNSIRNKLSERMN